MDGTLEGGSPPVVSVILRAQNLDVSGAGGVPCKWDLAADNFWDFNSLPSLPAGIGLTAAIDGSSSSITPTEAGVWAFSYEFLTTAGSPTISLTDGVGWFTGIQSAGGKGACSTVLALPLGSVVQPGISNVSGADPGALAAVYLSIVRLG